MGTLDQAALRARCPHWKLEGHPFVGDTYRWRLNAEDGKLQAQVWPSEPAQAADHWQPLSEGQTAALGQRLVAKGLIPPGVYLRPLPLPLGGSRSGGK